jgi:hypothetical protein
MGRDPVDRRVDVLEARVERLVAYIEVLVDLVRSAGLPLPPMGGGLNGRDEVA